MAAGSGNDSSYGTGAGAIRSLSGLAGSLIVLAGVVIGLSSAIVFNAGGSEILHLALGGGFVLLALSVFDFRLFRWVQWGAAVPITILAVIFTLQGLADLTRWPLLADVAYATLGQVGEKVLGVIFIAWCLMLVLFDSTGRLRWFGLACITVVAMVEVQFYWVRVTGGDINDALKLLYVPLFVWLALESWKRREI
jgi:hypothetical protein